MTQQRRSWNDKEATEFSDWLRSEPQLDSGDGFTTSDGDYIWRLDYMWRNYLTDLIMLLEEKRYLDEPSAAQARTYARVDNVMSKADPNYRGSHLIQFECTNPEDGAIYVDGCKMHKQTFIEWLSFNMPLSYYKSYYWRKHFQKKCASV